MPRDHPEFLVLPDLPEVPVLQELVVYKEERQSLDEPGHKAFLERPVRQALKDQLVRLETLATLERLVLRVHQDARD